jgi:hypothetical protein
MIACSTTSSRSGEGTQILPDLIAYSAKEGQAFHIAAFEGGGIFETVVKCDGCSGKDGAVIFSVIANREDVIELPALELVNALGAVVGNVDAQLAHDRYRLRANMAWVSPGAEDFEAIARVAAQEPFRHLAAG